MYWTHDAYRRNVRTQTVINSSHARSFFVLIVPEIVINDTMNLFLKTAISILLISNRNSFRVQSDKIASVHFI